jgi:hypothetical protein
MMKKSILTLIIISIAIMLFSFNHRLIQEEEIIPCQEITIKCAQGAHGNFVIKNQVEYDALLNVRSPHSDCGSYQLPPVDFDQYTLLGVDDGSAGCEFPKLEHKITKTDNVYSFNYTVKQQWICKVGFRFSIWCLIPKIDEKSIVEFNAVNIIEPRNEREKQELEEYKKQFEMNKNNTK